MTSKIPPFLRDNLLFWLDDMLGHENLINNLLSRIRQFFKFFKKNYFKLHRAKSVQFSKSIGWCGIEISSARIRFDLGRFDRIRHMEPRNNGAQLQTCFCAIQWLRSAIPIIVGCSHTFRITGKHICNCRKRHYLCCRYSWPHEYWLTTGVKPLVWKL